MTDVAIQGLNMKVNEAVERHARKKLDRLDRYLPGILDIRLDLSCQETRRNGKIAIAQITIRHQRGAILRVEERNGEFESAINLAVDKMYRQIERFKGRRANKKGREERAERYMATDEELLLAEAMPGDGLYDVAQEDTPQTDDLVDPVIVRRKDVEVGAMTEMEAAQQMELLGHTFFVFYNVNTKAINVIYKRVAGGYGVLVPHLTQM